jgi:hypothetical protein
MLQCNDRHAMQEKVPLEKFGAASGVTLAAPRELGADAPK